MTKVHSLKCWPKPFQALLDGSKTFEWRFNDRGYQVGDRLWLQEWDPATECYTGRTTVVEVTYLLAEGFGLPEGVVVMSVKAAPQHTVEWKKIDQHQWVLVDETGKIVANLVPDSLFSAVVDDGIYEVQYRDRVLGLYLGVEAAKKAVERHFKLPQVQ